MVTSIKLGIVNDLNSLSILQRNHSDSFTFSYEFHHNTVLIHPKFFQLNYTFVDIAYVTEYFIKKYHPERFLIHAQEELIQVYQANGYYQKGHYYQKIVDPYRNKLNDSIFDEEGYIIDQGHMKCIPFGWFDTKQKGCGWIATYNLLKANGISMNIQDIITDLEKHNFLGKVFGQEIFWLIHYLKQKGLDIIVSLPGYSSCLNVLNQCDSGILAYAHTRGAHYAAFTKLHDTTVHFYNAIYQKKNHVVELNTFLKQYSIFHGCIVIGCRNNKWR